MSMHTTYSMQGTDWHARELCSAVHDRDHVSLMSVLASKPELAFYHRLNEGLGLREYLKRST